MTPQERVASRYSLILAERAKDDRAWATKLTKPINPPKGIARDIVRENGKTDTSREDATDLSRRDIRPEDVFNTTPNNVSVLNLAQTGRDLTKALDKQVPKDKGHDAVSNLSQYLIETGGGGGAKPAGTKKLRGVTLCQM